MRWMAVMFERIATIQSTATIRFSMAPAMISTTRSGRSISPTGQCGIRLSARARA